MRKTTHLFLLAALTVLTASLTNALVKTALFNAATT